MERSWVEVVDVGIENQSPLKSTIRMVCSLAPFTSSRVLVEKGPATSVVDVRRNSTVELTRFLIFHSFVRFTGARFGGPMTLNTGYKGSNGKL